MLSQRNRGIVLTSIGWQKLEAAIQYKKQQSYRTRYTLEELSTLTGLDRRTISKVMERKKGSDKRSLKFFFEAFDLNLENRDYKKITASARPSASLAVDRFYGRTQELTQLQQWCLEEQCQLVALFGIGGIGKTALAAKFTKLIKPNFEFAIWRSLRNAPPLPELVSDLNQFISDRTTAKDLPIIVEDRNQLIKYLKQHRSLLVLDNAEAILSSKQQVGRYCQGYEVFGEFLQKIGKTTHQSCCLLISREKPPEITTLEGMSCPVRSMQLSGLKCAEAQLILEAKGVTATKTQLIKLNQSYSGNPLALKIVATSILELFGGNIAEFLQQGIVIAGGG